MDSEQALSLNKWPFPSLFAPAGGPGPGKSGKQSCTGTARAGEAFLPLPHYHLSLFLPLKDAPEKGTLETVVSRLECWQGKLCLSP